MRDSSLLKGSFVTLLKYMKPSLAMKVDNDYNEPDIDKKTRNVGYIIDNTTCGALMYDLRLNNLKL